MDHEARDLGNEYADGETERIVMATGIEVITQERERQVGVEGWTTEHDDEHVLGELRCAAAHMLEEPDARHDPAGVEVISCLYPGSWIEGLVKKHGARPRSDTIPRRVRRLAIAGALIAAEIDRLNRAHAAEKASTTASTKEVNKRHV